MFNIELPSIFDNLPCTNAPKRLQRTQIPSNMTILLCLRGPWPGGISLRRISIVFDSGRRHILRISNTDVISNKTPRIEPTKISVHAWTWPRLTASTTNAIMSTKPITRGAVTISKRKEDPRYLAANVFFSPHAVLQIGGIARSKRMATRGFEERIDG